MAEFQGVLVDWKTRGRLLERPARFRLEGPPDGGAAGPRREQAELKGHFLGKGSRPWREGSWWPEGDEADESEARSEIIAGGESSK
jgi:hypothetical protein